MAAPVLPDLVADAPEKAFVEDTQQQRLLRFDGHVHNAGPGALEVRKSGGSVRQRVYSAPNVFEDRPLPGAEVIYELTDGHNHFHIQRAARYSLWNAEGTGAVAPVMKVGFCLLDSESVGNNASPFEYGDDSECQERNGLVAMGVSAGWRDLYDRFLPFQWVDISSVSPGRYRLRSEVDPDGLIEEQSEANAPADASVSVPGYVARPAAMSITSGDATTVNLTSDAYPYPNGQPPAAREVRIERAPAHGSLDAPVGVWLTTDAVRYSPDTPGAPREDDFSFSVREANSRYPLSPAAAAVTLRPAVLAPGPGPTTVEAPASSPAGAPPAGAAPAAPSAGAAPAAPSAGAAPAEAPPVAVPVPGSSTEPAPAQGGLAGPPMQAPRPALAISGAPASMVAGTAVQLTAGDVGVTWSVGGVPGGDDRAGRISATGLLRAPAAVPVGGVVVVTASKDTSTAEVRIAVTATPTATPAPAAPLRAAPGRSRRLALGTVRRAGFVAVSAVPAKAGRLRISVFVAKRRIGGCAQRVFARRTYGCRVREPHGRRSVTVVATLRDRAGRTTQRRVTARSTGTHRHSG